MWLVWILSAGGRHFVEIFPNCDYLTSDSEKTDDEDDEEHSDDAAYTDYKVVKTGELKQPSWSENVTLYPKFGW